MKVREVLLTAYIVGAVICLAIVITGPPENKVRSSEVLFLMLMGLIPLFGWHIFR